MATKAINIFVIILNFSVAKIENHINDNYDFYHIFYCATNLY